MLEEAVARGATLVAGKATGPIVDDAGSVTGVRVRTPEGRSLEIESAMLLDCSGMATFLANTGVTGPKYLGNYDRQIAVFSQVAGAIREHGDSRDSHKDNTLIFYRGQYHWAWFIPLDDDTVSVGVVSPAAYFLEKKETTRDFLVRELHELHPELKRRLPEVKLVEDTHVIPNYSYQVKRFCGNGFMCVGDSHRFVDPIFSFGLWVSLKEAELAAAAVKELFSQGLRDAGRPFAGYQLYCEKGIDVLEDMIDLFWMEPLAFAAFVHERYRDDLTDIFAGRTHTGQPSTGTTAIRRLLRRESERERSYEREDEYSVPIGSRFHPELAPIWTGRSEMKTTEAWMGRDEDRERQA
jgi:flavin-dependent dehydrogenase